MTVLVHVSYLMTIGNRFPSVHLQHDRAAPRIGLVASYSPRRSRSDPRSSAARATADAPPYVTGGVPPPPAAELRSLTRQPTRWADARGNVRDDVGRHGLIVRKGDILATTTAHKARVGPAGVAVVHKNKRPTLMSRSLVCSPGRRRGPGSGGSSATADKDHCDQSGGPPASRSTLAGRTHRTSATIGVRGSQHRLHPGFCP